MIENLIVGIIAVLVCLFAPNKKGLIVSFVVVTAFLAFRYQWGNDYGNYMEWFQEIKGYSILKIFSDHSLSYRGDFLWSFLYLLFRPIGFFGFVIVLSIFENWVVFRVISNHVDKKYYWIAMFFYVFTTETFAVGASMMRQYLCICCFMIVVELMLNRKLILSLIIIIVCSFVHHGNIFTLAFLPVFYINVKSKTLSTSFYVIFAVLFLLWDNIPTYFISDTIKNSLSVFLSDDMSDYYLHYSENKQTVANTGLGRFFSYIVLATIIYIIPKVSKEHQSLLWFFVIGYFFTPLTRFVPMIHRYALYCIVFSCVVWPILINHKKLKPYIFALTAGQMIITIKTFYDFFHAPVWIENFMKYHTIFEVSGWM